MIELLVVISIIGVLAAIAIPQFMGRQGKAYDARVIEDARNAAAAEEAYFDDNTAYYSGPCSGMPGMSVSAGVSCTATGAGAKADDEPVAVARVLRDRVAVAERPAAHEDVAAIARHVVPAGARAGPGDAGEHEVGERDDGGKPHAGAATEQPLCP